MITDGAVMERALRLAAARLGHVAPNPAVGCVIVADGQVVGEGATGDGGRPHAEEIALAAAGAKARGASAFVTLEPCAQRSDPSHSACADRLINAQVARCVIACADPHPNAGGRGVAALRAAGVAVTTGVRAREAEALNAGFFSVVVRGRPLIAIDASPDGYDGEFRADPADDLRARLTAAGASGFTRMRVAPGTALADALSRAGLVDAVNG